MLELPMSLATSLYDGNCVLFLGAGIGFNSTSGIGSGLDLRDFLATRFNLALTESEDLALIAQVVEIEHGRDKLVRAIADALAGMEPDDDLLWLTSLPWRAIFTTNYDQLIERCYETNPSPAQRPVVMSANCEVMPWQPPFDVPLIHLHGSLQSNSARNAILITRKDYSEYRVQRGMLFDHLRYHYSSSPIVYIGYSNRDPNWQSVISEVQSQFAPNRPPTSYRIAPDTSAHERLVLESAGVTTIDGTIQDLREAYTKEFGTAKPKLRGANSNLEKSIPTDLADHFVAEPAATLRLLNSWEYVNQAPFGDEPNTHDFHRGDRPNWGLLARGIGFERDMESELVDRLFDFATDPSSASKCDIVLSPAGWGVTTLLLSVAAWFTRQHTETTVLWLRPGQIPRVSDVEFALRTLGRPALIVIDNAADHADDVDELWDFAKKSDLPIFLLLGERSNEWRLAHARTQPLEREMSPLSEGEIERLLDSLERSSALGHLADLPAPVRAAAIRNKNHQDLLVTMREVTEGRAFDAIIEDEYRSIPSARARAIYDNLCAMSRVGALARDFVLIDAGGLTTGDFYPLMREDLHGIAYTELVDESLGVWAYSCRHRVIADIVWRRCVDLHARGKVLSQIISSLNLTYAVDADAFKSLTRDEEGMGHLASFDAKTQFFEDACRKDVRNAFVRQHYARMLRSERKYELALAQIDRAVKLNPRARSIQHTRGVILANLAMDATTDGVGRRRLAQSEESFKRAIQANSHDEYSWRSLVDLYLDWAKKCSSSAEAIEYATKAQRTVDDGLQQAYVLDGLYVAASDVEEYFGNTPERIDALRAAVASSPESKVPRYLLGKVLTREKRYDEAKEVLELGITQWPDDPSMAIAYALAIYEGDGMAPRAIAALKLANLRGRSQARYVATLGGLLVMDGKSEEAAGLFASVWDLRMSARDRNKLQFVPAIRGEQLHLTGEVLLDGAAGRIEAPGYPPFFVRPSVLDEQGWKRGASVSFVPGFSARGPMSVDVSPV